MQEGGRIKMRQFGDKIKTITVPIEVWRKLQKIKIDENTTMGGAIMYLFERIRMTE